ncbi:MAG: type II toxin-antitoxin system PemK/MazF family toxin [Aeromicrobium sp.]
MDIVYAPKPDGKPDPGEIVWAWVPYEEDATRGKDRPVLIINREGEALIGLMMTSKDHDRDLAQEEREGRFWTDIGSGPWDGQGRESEVRTDRLVTLDPQAIRREGAVLDEARFNSVADDVRRHLD